MEKLCPLYKNHGISEKLSETSSCLNLLPPLCTHISRCWCCSMTLTFLFTLEPVTTQDLFFFFFLLLKWQNTPAFFQLFMVNCSLGAKKFTVYAWMFMRKCCIINTCISEWEQTNINTSSLSWHYCNYKNFKFYFILLTNNIGKMKDRWQLFNLVKRIFPITIYLNISFDARRLLIVL